MVLIEHFAETLETIQPDRSKWGSHECFIRECFKLLPVKPTKHFSERVAVVAAIRGWPQLKP